MGGNLCKELGINATKTIGTRDVDALWNGFAKNKSDLSRDDAHKFLKQFAKSIGSNYDEKLADGWINACGQTNKPKTLKYDDFLKLFQKAVSEGEVTPKISLTQTLATKLDFKMDLPEEQPTSSAETEEQRAAKEEKKRKKAEKKSEA